MESTQNRMELGRRESDGVTVTLAWDCSANRVIEFEASWQRALGFEHDPA